jgi:hypothetical protein
MFDEGSAVVFSTRMTFAQAIIMLVLKTTAEHHKTKKQLIYVALAFSGLISKKCGQRVWRARGNR